MVAVVLQLLLMQLQQHLLEAVVVLLQEQTILEVEVDLVVAELVIVHQDQLEWPELQTLEVVEVVDMIVFLVLEVAG
tara:strand:- start:56 stop:286 length:231 start_codon:yes stop_codon:yes gene_type:complete